MQRQRSNSYIRICRVCDEFYKCTGKYSRKCPDCFSKGKRGNYKDIDQNTITAIRKSAYKGYKQATEVSK